MEGIIHYILPGEDYTVTLFFFFVIEQSFFLNVERAAKLRSRAASIVDSRTGERVRSQAAQA